MSIVQLRPIAMKHATHFPKTINSKTCKALYLTGIVLFLSVNLFGQAQDKKSQSQAQDKRELKKIVDNRDGKSYSIVTIGSQTWFAENLAYKTWSYCYNDNSFNCQLLGRLYSWGNAKKSCPTGWHLPTDYEWQTLFKYIGDNPCLKLKSKGGFWPEGHYGTDDFDFSAIGAGYKSEENYWDLGKSAIFWSNDAVTRDGWDWGDAITVSCNSGEAGIKVLRGKDWGKIYASVRCIKD
jgi:uncharacterized protein (TIGR02145 family)